MRQPRALGGSLLRPRVRLRAAGRCRHRTPTVPPTRILQAPVQLLEERCHWFGRRRGRGALRVCCRGARRRGLASASESGGRGGGGAGAPEWRSEDMELIGRRGCFVGCRLLTLLLPLRLFMLLLSKETASAVFGEIVITSPRVVVVREQHEAPPGAARPWGCARGRCLGRFGIGLPARRCRGRTGALFRAGYPNGPIDKLNERKCRRGCCRRVKSMTIVLKAGQHTAVSSRRSRPVHPSPSPRPQLEQQHGLARWLDCWGGATRRVAWRHHAFRPRRRRRRCSTQR